MLENGNKSLTSSFIGLLLFIVKISSFVYAVGGKAACRKTSISNSNSMDIQLQVTNAFQAHKNGQVDIALEMYQNIIPHVQGTILATMHRNAGAICLSIGKYDDARDHFTKSVAVDPTSSQSHFNLAVILTTKFSEHGKAIRHCGIAIKLDPNMYKAYHLMGNILQEIGRPDDSLKYFSMAEKLATDQRDYASIAESNAEEVQAFHRYSSLQENSIGDISTAIVDDKLIEKKCVSKRPLIFTVPELLTKEECQHIISRAITMNNFEKSFVMGGELPPSNTTYTSSNNHTSPEGEKSPSNEASDPYRMSYTSWLSIDEVLRNVQRRIAALTDIPISYITALSEELQVVKYDANGRFKAHQDSSEFHSRLFTVLIYLIDVPESGGGETWFPFAGPDRPFNMTVDEAVLFALEEDRQCRAAVTSTVQESGSSTSSRRGLVVTPKVGTAVIFFNHLPDGRIDPAAVHAGLPVGVESHDTTTTSSHAVDKSTTPFEAPQRSSQKWIANYWVRDDPALLTHHRNIG